MTFIQDYSKYILDKYPTNSDWADLCSLTAIASAISRNTAIYTKMGPMRLNIFSLDIGPSRLAYKSLPLRECLIPTLYNLGENLNRRFLLPARYSMEGLIEYMCEYSSQGCIIRDEFTSQFKDVRNKRYLAEGMEFLSELYDGLLQIRYTKKSKLEEVMKVYVNYISATTPYIFSVMSRDFFIQGTGNRILYVYSEPIEDDIIVFEQDYAMAYNEMIEVEEEHMEFARRLGVIREATPRYIGISLGKPLQMLGYFSRRWTKKAFELYNEEKTDIKYSYYANLKEFVLKLSALHCLSRNEPAFETFNDNQLLVTDTDMRWAINKVNDHVKYFNKLMTAWGSTAVSRPAVTSKGDWDLVVSLIELEGGKIMHSTLRKKTSWGYHKFMDTINAMLAAEIIEGLETTEGSTSHKRTFYTIVKR